MEIPTSTTAPPARSPWQAVWLRWPAALGLAAAAFQLATGADREAVTITLGVALLCYLGAAALNLPWVAWAGILGGSLVVTVTELADLDWWVGVAAAAAFLVVVGLLGPASRPALTAQTAALIGFGGVAVGATYIDARIGLALAGVALASHAVWDVIHYRRNVVVPRSLAEFCLFLDVPIGVGAIIIAIVD
jgi:hypothetical protein